MKIATICMAVVLGLTSAGALAQVAGVAMEKLRVCSVPADTERLDCLSRPAPATPPGTSAAADNWIVSETTSPVDYTPVAIATALSTAGSDGAELQLSIRCRGGRTDLVIAGPTITRRAEDYVVSYGVDGGQPVALTAGAPASGTGLAIKGDIVRLLASLPDRGEVAFRVTTLQGAAVEGRYAIGGLKTVRDRLAVPCKWPSASAPTK